MNMDASEPLTGGVQFVPTLERILYGASIIKGHLASEVERLSAQRVLLLTPRSFKGQSVFEHVTATARRALLCRSQRLAHSGPGCERARSNEPVRERVVVASTVDFTRQTRAVNQFFQPLRRCAR